MPDEREPNFRVRPTTACCEGPLRSSLHGTPEVSSDTSMRHYNGRWDEDRRDEFACRELPTARIATREGPRLGPTGV